MSTHVTLEPETSSHHGVRLPSRLDDVPTQKVPFSRLVHAELRKSVDTRAGRWLLVVIALLTLVSIAVLFFAGETSEDHSWGSFISITSLPQQFLLPIVGIMVVTAEWSQRTGLVTFTLEPHRGRIGWAKLVSALGLGLGLIVVGAALAAAATLIADLTRTTNPDWALEWQPLVGLLGAQMIGVAIGVAFGMLLQNTPAAVVTYLMLPTLWTILGESISWLKTAAEWLDTQRTLAPLYDGEMVGQDWARLAVSVAVWVVIPLAAGMWRLRRSEVK